MKRYFSFFLLIVTHQLIAQNAVNWLIKPQFDSIYAIQSTYFAVVKNNKFGIVNSDNKVLIPLQFDDLLCPYSDEPFIVGIKKKGKWGFVNQEGKIIIPCQFDAVSYFKKNGLAAVSKNKKWGFINAKGEKMIDYQYTYTSGFMEDGTAVVGIINDSIADQWQINEKNERIKTTDPGNEMMRSDPNNAPKIEALIVFEDKGKYGLKKGNTIILNAKYQSINSMPSSSVLFFVVLNNKYGFINHLGEELISPQFDTLLTSSFNWAAVKQNNKWGLVKLP